MDFSENKNSPSFFALLSRRDFALLFFAHLFFGMAFWSYVLFPAHLQALGADPLQIGILMGCASLSGVLVRPWIGGAIDRNGRKRYLMIGGVIFLITHLLYWLLPNLGWTLFLIRLLHGIGTGTLMATLFTVAADLSPPTRRVSGMALFGVSGQLSGTIGVPLAETVVRMGGFSTLFLLSAFFSGVSLLLCCFIRETLEDQGEIRSEPFFKMAFNPALRALLFTALTFSLGVTSYIIFLKPYAHHIGINRVDYFFMTYTLMAICIRVTGGDWPEKYGHKSILISALGSLAVGVVLIALIPSMPGLIVSGLLCGVGHGLVVPILSSMVIRRGGEACRGGLMTLYTLVFDLGMLIGSPFFGGIVKLSNYTALYLIAAFLVVMGMMVLIRFDRVRNEVNALTKLI